MIRGMAAKLRRIVVGGEVYLWKVEHAHDRASPSDPERRCREVFTAYREGDRAGPLRVVFRDADGRHAGYPAAGVVWTDEDEGATVNLNTPRVARRLLEAAMSLGWTPRTSRVPFVVEDGFALLPLLRAE